MIRVFANVNSISGIDTTTLISQFKYGTYSWGYLELGSRIGARDFKFYGQDGLGGISTSGFIQRFNPLRDKEYL